MVSLFNQFKIEFSKISIMRLNLVSHNKKKIHMEALKRTSRDKVPNLHNGFFNGRITADPLLLLFLFNLFRSVFYRLPNLFIKELLISKHKYNIFMCVLLHCLFLQVFFVYLLLIDLVTY